MQQEVFNNGPLLPVQWNCILIMTFLCSMIRAQKNFYCTGQLTASFEFITNKYVCFYCITVNVHCLHFDYLKIRTNTSR